MRQTALVRVEIQAMHATRVIRKTIEKARGNTGAGTNQRVWDDLALEGGHGQTFKVR